MLSHSATQTTRAAKIAITLVSGLLFLSACVAKEQAPAAPKYSYELAGKVQKVRLYTDKSAPGAPKYWGAAIKVMDEQLAGSPATTFPYFGTLRRYKLEEADAQRLKRGMKIRAVEHTDVAHDKDEYFHVY